MLVSDCTDIVWRKDILGDSLCLSSVQNDRQEVLGASVSVSHPLGHNLIKPAAEFLVGALNFPVHGVGNSLEDLPEGFLENRDKQAEDDGE